MSAFIVDTKHIDYLIQAALTYSTNRLPIFLDGEWAILDDRTADQWGQTLVAHNHASVNHRYAHKNQPTQAPDYAFPWMNDIRGRLCPVQTLKALDCYEYQSCEHDAWGTSPAKAFCDALRTHVIAKLPGYEQAEWEITQ